LTSEHFWDQMNFVPPEKLPEIEQALVREVVGIEQLQPRAVAYDTTNFYTHIATTNLRAELPQRGHNKQGRHDLRQMGLALVVDQLTQLPLAHVLYEGARSDMKTFADFLKPVRKHLLELTGQSDQLTEHVHRREAGPLPGDSGLHVQFAFIGRRRDVGAISKRNILQSQRESLPQQDWNAR